MISLAGQGSWADEPVESISHKVKVLGGLVRSS